MVREYYCEGCKREGKMTLLTEENWRDYGKEKKDYFCKDCDRKRHDNKRYKNGLMFRKSMIDSGYLIFNAFDVLKENNIKNIVSERGTPFAFKTIKFALSAVADKNELIRIESEDETYYLIKCEDLDLPVRSIMNFKEDFYRIENHLMNQQKQIKTLQSKLETLMKNKDLQSKL